MCSLQWHSDSWVPLTERSLIWALCSWKSLTRALNLLSNVFTQLENGPSQTHWAAIEEHTGSDIFSVKHTCSLAHTHLPSHTSGSPQHTGTSLVTCPHPSVHMQTPSDLEITRRGVPLIEILPACKVIQAMQGWNFTGSRG